MSGSRADGLSLEVRDGGAVLLALASGGVVTLHAVQEILTAAGVTHLHVRRAKGRERERGREKEKKRKRE